MVASYQKQLSELYRMKLSDASLPTMYKWTPKDERLGRGSGLSRRVTKPTSILIETKNAILYHCINGCENCEGFFEVNGRRYSCKCSRCHHNKVDLILYA